MTCVARPDPRAEVDDLEPRLLAQLARERMLVRLAGLEAATRSRPDATAPGSRTGRAGSGRPDPGRPPVRPGEASSQEVAERLEPAQPLGPGDRGVRGRGRREHEERRLAEATLLQPELRRARRTRRGTPPCRRSRSPVAAARRAIRSSRSAEPAKSPRLRSPEPGVVRYAALVTPMPELQQLELLARLVEARREARSVQEPPEVVARVGEVGVRGGGDATGVDPAEDRRQPGGEDVRDVALRRLRVLRESSLSSKSDRSSSPEMGVS